MKPANHLLSAVVVTLLATGFRIHSQELIATGAPAQNWVALASSADGSKLVGAASYGWIYLSSNSGAAWNPAVTVQVGQEPQRPWTSVGSSADGMTLVAAANFQPIFLSTNGGGSWQQTGQSGDWAAVAISGAGSDITAADSRGGIYMSQDSGTSWSATTAPNRRWRSLTCSSDGKTLFAGSDFGTNYGEVPAIYVSSDAGASWTRTSAPGQPWQALACSADGSKAVAGAYGGLVYLTADSGATWTQVTLPARRWGGVACSSDAGRLIVAAWEGDVDISSDSGRTWNRAKAPAGPWSPVASSADGIHLFAGIWDASSGGVYEANLPPVLHIEPSDNGTVVSWAGPATGYVLQQNSDISSANWHLVTTPPSFVAGENRVLVGAAQPVSAYRLVRTASPLLINGRSAASAPLTAGQIAPGGF
jgi:hypothetical protein